MLSLVMFVLLTNPTPTPKPAPAPVIVNVATVEFKDNSGTTYRSSSNAVETKVTTTIATNACQ